jgi:UDP-N-acetylglucosamine--N-acetylmuramyl-(pentapeptide) pyrophosphoryl-undecaprenol N-acetylglucosamine transferase
LPASGEIEECRLVRLLLSGGGTGGHVYPALAVVDELKSASGPKAGSVQILYAGTELGLEKRIAEQAGLQFAPVRAAGLRGLSPVAVLANAAKLLAGLVDSLKVMARFHPDVVLATGGYASVPIVLVAWLSRCPVVIYLPDIEPGLAVRALSHIADVVAVSLDRSRAFFPAGKAVVTGYPVRAAVRTRDNRAAREALGLDEAEKVVLVFGGSRGAHSINRAVDCSLDELVGIAQIVHITGQGDYEWLQSRRLGLPAHQVPRYHVYSYLHKDMVNALCAADLAVARAGAATLGEFPTAGLPSILVPYPFSGQHQRANAEFMAEHGAAIVLADQDVERDLATTVRDLLLNQEALKEMGRRASELAEHDAANKLAGLLLQQAGGV